MKKKNVAQRDRPRSLRQARINFKPVIIGVLILFFILLAAHNLRKCLRTLALFEIDEVIFSQKSNIDASFLKRENIFALDLKRFSAYIMMNHPIYRQANIVRILPNRIFVDLKERKAIALVKLHKYFSVDKEAVLFGSVDLPFSAGGLPVITGLEAKISSPRFGKRYNIRELVICLNMIRRFALNRTLNEYKINRVHVDKLTSISFFMRAPFTRPDNLLAYGQPKAGDFEVRIDAYNIREKFALLAGLLNQEKDNLGYIKYIDLRFKEPVIKFNEDKPKSST